MKFTYYGHSCFAAEINGSQLLFDPFITGNPLAKDVRISDIRCNFVFLSHGHADHVADAAEIAKHNPDAVFVAAYEVCSWLEKQGVKKYHPMNTGGKKKFGFGSVKCVDARHSSSMPDGSYGGNPMGFVIESTAGNFYYAGDTALHSDMQLIPQCCGKLNVALLPIGDNFTMGYEDAVLAAGFVQCNKVVALHYDTFGFIVVDHEAAKAAFAKAGKQLHFIPIGKSLEL